MKEFNCEAASTWPSCDDQKEVAFTRTDNGNGRHS